MGTPIYNQLVRSTSDNVDLQLASEVEAVLWDWALNLWHLMLFPGRRCQNYVQSVGPPVRVYWKLKSWMVILENISVWNVMFSLFFFFAMLCVMWDLSSPTRDQTCAPCIGRVESEPPDGQWNSSIAIFYCHRLDGGNTTGLAVKGQGCC